MKKGLFFAFTVIAVLGIILALMGDMVGIGISLVALALATMIKSGLIERTLNRALDIIDEVAP